MAKPTPVMCKDPEIFTDFDCSECEGLEERIKTLEECCEDVKATFNKYEEHVITTWAKEDGIQETLIVLGRGWQSDAPVINGADDVTIELNSEFDPLAGVTATDKDGNDITDNIVVEGEVDTSEADEYVLTYTVTDSEGMTTEKQRVVTVVYNPSIKITYALTVSDDEEDATYLEEQYDYECDGEDAIPTPGAVFGDEWIGYTGWQYSDDEGTEITLDTETGEYVVQEQFECTEDITLTAVMVEQSEEEPEEEEESNEEGE